MRHLALYHGTHRVVAEFAPFDAKRGPLFLTSSFAAATAYGPVVHTVEFATEYDIGGEDDIREAAEFNGLDDDDESRVWGFLDYPGVVSRLAKDFDAVYGMDCFPGTDGSQPDDQHDFFAVFGGKVRVLRVADLSGGVSR